LTDAAGGGSFEATVFAWAGLDEVIDCGRTVGTCASG